MEILRFILFPFALVYGLVVRIRNKLFDWKIIKPVSFPIPVIAIGNLVAGGSGKTPLTEYIVRLLQKEFRVATLSRGYRRKTKGFRIVNASDKMETAGDEPLQYALKFPDITVAVDERRKHGIRQLMAEVPGLEAVILDDAYQHRYVMPGIAVLVTDYQKIYMKDYLMPVGRLREHRKSSKRSDIIVVSKTPKIFSPLVRRQLLEELKPLPQQLVCFSYITYEDWIPVFPDTPVIGIDDRKVNTILMVTGVANPSPMEEYIRPYCSELSMMEFPDHHNFSEKDIHSIRDTFISLPTRRKLLVTTEKDAVRLKTPEAFKLLGDLPFYYVTIRFNFHPGDKEKFHSAILALMHKKILAQD